MGSRPGSSSGTDTADHGHNAIVTHLMNMAPRRLAPRLLTALITAGLACAAGAQQDVRLPDLGSSANALISPQEAQDYGASMLRQMRALDMVVDDPLLDDYVNDLGYRLVASSDKPKEHFAFFIVRDQEINAFAAPGGYIAVNAGLMTITRDESELAGVVAHEIGHITQNHLQRAFEDSKKDAPLIANVLLDLEVHGAPVSRVVVTVPFADLFQSILTDQVTGTNSYDAFVFAPQWMVDYIAGGYLEASNVDMGDEKAQDAIDLRFLVAVRDRAHLEVAMRTLKRTASVMKVQRAKPGAGGPSATDS